MRCFISSVIMAVLVVGLFAVSNPAKAGQDDPGSEVIAKRTANSKHFRNPDGSFTMRAYCTDIHYLDRDSGRYEEIDTTIRKNTMGQYEMRKASYGVKLSEEVTPERYPVQFLAVEHALAFMPRRICWRNSAGQEQPIATVAKVSHPQVQENVLTYPNVFGPGIDLEIICQEDHMAKVVVFRSPTVLPAATISDAYLAIDYSIRSDVPVTMSADGESWDTTQTLSTSGRVRIDDIRTGEQLAQIWRPRVWDIQGNQSSITLAFRKLGKQTIMTKQIAASFLAEASFPVRTDTVTSVYATDQDSAFRHNETNYTWSSLRNAGQAATTNPGQTWYPIGITGGSSNGGYIKRAAFCFDTSSLGSQVVISDAKLKVVVSNIRHDYSDSLAYISVVHPEPAGTAITVDDYDSFTGLPGAMSKGANDIELATLSSGLTTWTLDATGRNWLDPTGQTWLGIAEGHDIENSEPAGGLIDNTENDIQCALPHVSGTTNDPVLEITYQVVPSDPANPNPADGAYIADSTPLCSWSASTDPDSPSLIYYYTLADNMALANPILDRTNAGTDTFYQNPTLDDGTYYWRAEAYDGQNYNTNPATWSFVIDTQEPGPLGIDEMVCKISTHRILELRGTGEDGTDLTFYDENDQAIPGSVSWNGGGHFTFTPSTPLPPGGRLYAVSSDQAGWTSQSRSGVPTFDYIRNVYPDSVITHDGTGQSMRLDRATSYTFKFAVNGGQQVTVSAWLRKNHSGNNPQLRLQGMGIDGTGSASATMPDNVDLWVPLSVTGTPSQGDGIIHLTIESYDETVGSSVWIDDLAVTQ